AGGEGLEGMKWRGAAPFGSHLRLIRPLLDVRKEQLAAYAGRQGIAFREDASNASLDHLRNRVRHELLPVIVQQFGPETVSTILRTMTIIGAETECVETTARKWLAGRREESFDRLPVAVQRQCLLLQLRQLGVAPKFDLIESLRQFVRKPVMTAPGHSLIRSEAGEIHRQDVRRESFDPGEVVVELDAKSGQRTLGDVTFRWKVECVEPSVAAKQGRAKPGCEYFDAAKLGDSLRLRHWRRGDRYQPIGMKHEVKLQDVFINRKIPRARRHELVVATTEAGRIFWVEGLRISEEFKLDNHTTSRLKWQWLRQSPVTL
ncbi:MAG: tRNA lysidine(34) synthetase TilS, partial [Pedosphaera parvula]|nr:tRNA lysidine(34) synthetase TilS [Pedosphaera parvula]